MRLRPNFYYCLFSLIANICLSLNNQPSVVLKYFYSSVPGKLQMALRGFWVSVIRRLFVTVTGQTPGDLVWWVEVPGEEFNWSPGNWKLLSAHHLCTGLGDHQHRILQAGFEMRETQPGRHHQSQILMLWITAPVKKKKKKADVTVGKTAIFKKRWESNLG